MAGRSAYPRSKRHQAEPTPARAIFWCRPHLTHLQGRMRTHPRRTLVLQVFCVALRLMDQLWQAAVSGRVVGTQAIVSGAPSAENDSLLQFNQEVLCQTWTHLQDVLLATRASDGGGDMAVFKALGAERAAGLRPEH